MSATTPFISHGQPASSGWTGRSVAPAGDPRGTTEWFAATPATSHVLSARVTADAPKDAEGWARRLVGHLLDDPASR